VHFLPIAPALALTIALVAGGVVVSAVPAASTSIPDTAISHSDDGDRTSVLVHGTGAADTAKSEEGRRFAHSDLQPAGRFVERGQRVRVSVPTGAPEMSVAVGLLGTYAAHNAGADVGHHRTELHAGENEVVAPHDGVVSMVSSAAGGRATVTISGGEPLPTYVRGQSTAASFQADLRRFADAPFVEVVSDRVFGDFQRAATGAVIAADDLDARTANWDRVVELTNATYGLVDDAVGTSHKHRHRIHIASPDRGAGYASASDQRITFQVDTGAAADLFRTPPRSQWALWHEIGHTYESIINSFPGTAETITNVSALAVQDGLGFGSRWDESTAAFEEYFASEDREWVRAHDRVRLLAWEQLRRAFGDAFLPRFFAALRSEAATVNPHVLTADDKHALFVRVASAVAERDLAPFYDALGFPMSDPTRATIAGHPDLEQRIWDNVDSRDRIVERVIPAYDPPVGVVDGPLPDVSVGMRTLAAPTVSGLGTASGRGEAVVVGATGWADVVGDRTGRVIVRLRSDNGTEDAIIAPTRAVGGDSVVLRGQSNRHIGSLWIDAPRAALGWRAGTSYAAHTSWQGREYTSIVLFDRDGSEVARGAIRGEQTGTALDAVFDGRSYRDGQFLLVTHAQPTLLAAYGSDEAIHDGSAPQAFLIEDGRLVAVDRAEIPGWQVVRGAAGTPAVLERGTDTAVEARLSVHATITTMTAAVELTSPAGTTLAPGQTTLAGEYRRPGEDWRPSTNLLLRDGVPGDHGTTSTFRLRTGAGFGLPLGSEVRWKVLVRVPATIAPGDSELGVHAVGSAS
jgi:hypothetical protein